MIVFHGSTRRIDQFTSDMITQQPLPNDIDSIGYWFTSDIEAAKPFAIGTMTSYEKSASEFWEDGEPKVVQIERPVTGYIYKVYIDDPKMKVYETYEMFMAERDRYCDYFRKQTWKDPGILLNKPEANHNFRKHLIGQKYDGFLIRNIQLHERKMDLSCFFEHGILQIAQVIPLE
ncbi:hypothetical protein M3182_12665 [Mesobacillus maritimus]|uniref:hypothetical protein n=1 Tax=Mesobacillus maritimus TaxID=1643336 RepID=UPI00203E721C|nr:hypothetical protein [Mesobacillus maritimus]MCM3586584.1 hypothetical protein [Mesobacillus maritimus]MCM3668662.1 hypothetical protein [Mesobacillus maritimus]